MWRSAESISPSVSSATPEAFAPPAVATLMPRSRSNATGRLSTPTPLRLIERNAVAARMTASETGSTPTIQPMQPGTSRRSSASPGRTPGLE